jgi:AcrR family transcriptional regulator
LDCAIHYKWIVKSRIATLSAMGTEQARLTRKGKATRDRIVAVAASEIYQRGVARTSLDEIKAAAGVSSSQLYHYFADKQELVLAVIDHQADAIMANQDPLIWQLDSLEALRSWRDLVVALQRAQGYGGCPLGTLAGELADTDPRARAELVVGLGRWEGAIRDGLRAMHERGELRADGDPDRLATALFAALQGGIALTHVRRATEPLEAALDAMLDHIASYSQ